MVSESEMENLMAEALARLSEHGTGNDIDDMADEQWLRRIKDICLPGDLFQASNIRLHRAAFEQYFAAAGALQRKPVQRLLSWLEDGLQLDFCHPRAAHQLQHPRYASKLRQVEQLLRQQLPACDVAGMIDCDKPQQIAFSNRVSCEKHAAWVSGHIAELLRVGTLRRWPADGPRPMVISGMGVVPKAGGKFRLILDCRYLNLFIR